MKRKNTMILGMTVSLLAANAWSATAESKLFDAFLRCDGEMFRVLNTQQKALSAYAPIEKIGKWAHFQTTGSAAEQDVAFKEQSVAFKKPLEINGVRLVGYSQRFGELPLNESGNNPAFYFWGFDIEGRNAADLISKLPQLGLKKSGTSWMGMPQIITDTSKSLKWQPNDLATDGSLPAKNTVEKLMYLGENDGKLTLSCTIQGYIPQELLRRERPDLGK